MRLPFALWFLPLYFFSQLVGAKEILHSSVPPDFPNGLHAKYIQYIAQKMNMQLDVFPMPFARRVLALRNGQIDMMVGMQRASDVDDEVIYIYPSYEKLRHTLFVLKASNTQLNTFEDLTKLKIGVTRHAKYYKKFEQQENLSLVAVSSLQQKVETLLKGRIDTFIHYQESTEPLLKELQLEDKVILAPFQLTELQEYYVAISEKSALLPYKDKLQKVVEQGVINGDFRRIRQMHYEQK